MNAISDILLHPAWVEWNATRVRGSAEEITYGAMPGTFLRCVMYRDARHRIVTPALVPYMGLSYEPTSTKKRDRLERQWHDMASTLALTLKAHLKSSVPLPPGVGDARPFQWSGLIVEPRYTYYGDPRTAQLSSDFKRKAKNASRLGYKFDVGISIDDVFLCLRNTEKRQGFTHRVSAAELRDLTERLGAKCILTHGVRDASGTVVSAGVRLVSPLGGAYNWIQGTDDLALREGASQLMYQELLRDLADRGVRNFDLGGANLRTVAHAKSQMGFELVPFWRLSSVNSYYIYAQWRRRRVASQQKGREASVTRRKGTLA